VGRASEAQAPLLGAAAEVFAAVVTLAQALGDRLHKVVVQRPPISPHEVDAGS
jgi:hypothetical protein